MTHPTELLAEFVAGTLPAATAARVGEHLVGCPECARTAAGWRRVAGAVTERVAAVPPPPPGLLDAVLTRLSGERSGAAAIVPRYAAPLGSAPLARAGRVLARQWRLVDRRVWPVGAAVLAFGTGLAALAPSGLSGQVLGLVVPLVAALAVAGACASGDPADELVLTTRTGVRAVLLARLTLVLGGTFVAASIASAILGRYAAGGPAGLLAAWLGPMALLSALSFALSVLWRAAVGIGAAMALWVLRLLAGTTALTGGGTLDATVHRAIESLWHTSGPVLLAAVVLVAVTVLLLPHLPAAPRRSYGG